MKYFFVSLSLCIFGCSGLPQKPDSLGNRSPSVLSVVPSSPAVLSIRPEWKITFSQPMDASTMDSTSTVLIPEKDLEKTPLKTTKALLNAIDDGDVSMTLLHWDWEEDGRGMTVSPAEDLVRGVSYALVLTPRLLSQARIPLKPLAELPEPASFILHYKISGDENFPIGEFEEAPSEEETTDNTDETPPEEIAPPEPEIPGAVLINEIFYDAVGSDTDGVVFVELSGPAAKKIGGYTVAFVDGSDGSVDDKILLPAEARIPEDGFFVIADAKTGSASVSQVLTADLVDNFDPQNGPDAIQLFNAEGHLIDVIGYGAGLAASSEEGFPLLETNPAMDVANGKSLERITPGQDTDNNAADFIERAAPTPGL